MTFEYLNILISLRLVTVYRPQPQPSLQDFAIFLETLTPEPHHFMIVGDFHFHLNATSDCNAMSFLDLIAFDNLYTAHLYTHISEGS